MRYRVFDKHKRPTLQVFDRFRVFRDDTVVAVRVIPDDNDSGVHAADTRASKRVHLGDSQANHGLVGHVAVDAFTVVVDEFKLDVHAIFLGVLREDAGGVRIRPGFPPRIMRPDHFIGRAFGLRASLSDSAHHQCGDDGQQN